MSDGGTERLKSIKDYSSLIDYLREDLDWPIEAENADDLAFDYDPEELHLDESCQVKIKTIKQLRPLVSNQPWGIFFVEFESKRLPVVVLRRILRALIPKKRTSARGTEQAVWNLHDLLFISAMGEEEHRRISFAHFKENGEGIPMLQTFSWDERETHFYYIGNDINNLRWPEDEEDTLAWREQWGKAFRTKHRDTITTSKKLSQELARIAKRTRDVALEVYEVESKEGPLHKLFDSFKKVLIHDLDVKRFADMVAQTIAYGFFSAKATGDEVMGLAHLEDMIPNTNTFLKELFAEFSKVSGHKRDQIDFDELGVSELVDMFNNADMHSILADFGRQTGAGREDPVVNFYELFLKEYDKEQKVKRGVFYTPKPVVSFIVRSVDEILKKDFGLEDGLADTTTWGEMAERNKDIKVPKGVSPHSPFVQILDPAVGTGTFLETVIEIIHDTMVTKWRKQGKTRSEIVELWNKYAPEHLLPRLYGFELMMAPYAVCHMKIGLKLKETGYDFESQARLRVYLTNALEEPKDFSGMLFAKFLAHEAEQANRVKEKAPVTVVIGNPPYSVFSQNKIEWIESDIRNNYYPHDEIKELNPKVLLDDYVKFIRYSQIILDKTGFGILGMITNNIYLDNPLSRRMRINLTNSFNRIQLLNLHGNVNKKETCPDGTPDSNVFGIKEVGTAIGIFTHITHTAGSNVFYTDLWGSGEKKCLFLDNSTLETLDMRIVTPVPLFNLFVPQRTDFRKEYASFLKLTRIMPFNNTGFITSRDHFVLGFEPIEIMRRLDDFANISVDEAREKYQLRDVRERNLKESHKMVKAMNDKQSKIITCLYRPFDFRSIFYHHSLVRWPVYEVMEHMLVGENIGLVANRQITSLVYCHTNASRYPIEYKSGSHDRNTQLFPLYIYPIGQQDLQHSAVYGRRPNFSPDFIKELEEKLKLTFIPDRHGDLKKTFGPQDVFHYIYSILHTPTYRTRYAEFLKLDFPRIPQTSDLDLFRSLCELGCELVALHLMESDKLDNHITTFHDKGNRTVTRVGETGKNLSQEKDGKGRLYINDTAYFDGLSLDVWNFHVGGYQVCYKWLYDRKKAGRTLSDDDIEHYNRIVVALNETIRLMKQIDKVIDSHGGWPIQ